MGTAIFGAASPAGAGDSISPQLVQEATARMFRSVRAGRSWVRDRQSTEAAPAVAACVAMKPGNAEPPVFMIPGAPGSILQLGPLAAALRVPMPAYAIKPQGLEEGEIPCQSIEQMAEYSIAVMRAVRPNGPYLLLGYSAGGLVALEMAQQLSAAGSEVPVVVLLDTYPGKQTWPLLCHAEIIARQTVKALWLLRRYSPSQAAREATRRLRSLQEYLAASGVKLLTLPPVVPEGWSAASRRVHVATFNAGEAYRPSRYSGKVIFVQPGEVSDLEPRAPEQVWRKHLSDLEVRRVPGSHLGMIEAGGPAIAAQISEYLEQALRLPPAGPYSLGR
jgi:acetoacetyl-CoA synthetase